MAADRRERWQGRAPGPALPSNDTSDEGGDLLGGGSGAVGGAPGGGRVGTWKSGILGTCGAAARGRFSVFQDFRFSPSQLRTRRGASPGAQPAASCRIRSAPFDYWVKAPDTAAEHHAAIKEIVSIQQGE